MVFKITDKEGALGGKGIDFSLFGLNDNKQDAKIFAELSEMYKKEGDHTDVFKQKIKGLTEINREYAKTIEKNTKGNANLSQSFLAASQSAGKMTVASRAATVAMGALKTVGTVVANMAMIAAVSALVMLPFQIAQAANEARIAATEGAKALVEDANAIDNYKIKIGELQKALNSGNLTQGEAYNKRKELMSIQDELIGKYGTEKEVVDINNFLKKRFLSTIT